MDAIFNMNIGDGTGLIQPGTKVRIISGEHEGRTGKTVACTPALTHQYYAVHLAIGKTTRVVFIKHTQVEVAV